MDDAYWIEKFGQFKKVVDLQSGKAHKVPTLEIVRNGLRQKDLKRFPLWLEN